MGFDRSYYERFDMVGFAGRRYSKGNYLKTLNAEVADADRVQFNLVAIVIVPDK